MGWNIISYCWLSFDEKDTEKIKLKLNDLKIERKEELYSYVEVAGEISFKLDGDKYIDYGVLEKLRDYCIKEKIPIEINCNEYVENGDGFYYNSEEAE